MLNQKNILLPSRIQKLLTKVLRIAPITKYMLLSKILCIQPQPSYFKHNIH